MNLAVANDQPPLNSTRKLES